MFLAGRLQGSQDRRFGAFGLSTLVRVQGFGFRPIFTLHRILGSGLRACWFTVGFRAFYTRVIVGLNLICWLFKG